MRILHLPIVLAAALLMPAAAPAEETKKLPTSSKAEFFMTNAKIRTARQLKDKGMQLGAPVFLRIFKESKELELWLRKGDTFELFKTYPICAASGSLGPKLKEGDEQSPEGFYSVSGRRLNPDSNYYLSFDIGYPNEFDRQNRRTGSAIMVHGRCVSQGCFAMGNLPIEEIYLLAHQAFLQGQEQFSVHVFPFRLTKENLDKHKDSPWLAFWKDLKEGYEAFEHERKVPLVIAKEGKYVVREQRGQDVVMISRRVDVEDTFHLNE